jgi:peptidoglycan/xylan/chitin deacetylase (PgdA/CDA1 family)
MYHGLTPRAQRAPAVSDWFDVPARTFEAQLDLMRALGYPGRSIEHALAHPDARHVAVSFDDGVVSHFEAAFPALSARGMTATFFITTAWVGKPGYVTWPQLREMKIAGMSIQSHTRTHPFLSELTLGKLRDELAGSKADLDDALGQATDTLALPGGDAPAARFRSLVEEVGYRVVATSRWGTNPVAKLDHAPRWLRRCTVRGAPAEAVMRSVLDGDPWLALRHGARERMLGLLRDSLGATRYAKWRRLVLRHVTGEG